MIRKLSRDKCYRRHHSR